MPWGTDLRRALQCAAFLPQSQGHRPGFVVFTEETPRGCGRGSDHFDPRM
ncbi:hypothetical protein WCP94_003818 [Bilophila wadsworthia]